MKTEYFVMAALASSLSAFDACAAPTPKNLVTLASSGNVCVPAITENNPTKLFDQRVLADGTVVPFSVPAGKVLVVTGVDWKQTQTSCSTCGEEFFLFSADANQFGPLMNDSVTLPNGTAKSGATVPITGVAMKSGRTLCFQVESGNIDSADAIAHGYLALDR